MADQHLLPIAPRAGAAPAGLPREMALFANQMQQEVRDLYRLIAERVESLIIVGTIAQRPAANGTLRFYFATDESPPVLYFDDGTWNPTNAT